MSFQQFLFRKLFLFFILSTLITVAIAALGSAFDPAGRFGYDAMLSPLIYAACCVLPSFVTYSRRELRPGELLGRMALELLLIEAVVLTISFSSPVIDTDRSDVVFAIAGSVLVIYVLVCLIAWLWDSAEAKRMNEDLRRFQQLHGEDAQAR